MTVVLVWWVCGDFSFLLKTFVKLLSEKQKMGVVFKRKLKTQQEKQSLIERKKLFCFSCLLGLPVRISQFLYLLFHLLQLFLRVFSLMILICCSFCCLALWRPLYVLNPSLPVFSPPLHPVLSLLGPASTSGASQALCPCGNLGSFLLIPPISSSSLAPAV